MATRMKESELETENTEIEQSKKEVKEDDTAPAEKGDEEEEEEEKEFYGHPRSFIRALISEAAIGYTFWTVFHGLAPMVWYYPLNQLEITGYEAYSLVWFSPLLCISTKFLDIIQSKTGILILRLLCVASLASFQAPTTSLRLQILAAGNFFALLLVLATWWHKSAYQRCISFWGHMLGFIALLASRIWFVSITPAWSDAFSNNVVISIGIIATIDRFMAVEYPLPEAKPNTKVSPHWKKMATGFGSLLFFTHCLFGDVAVLCRWLGIGHPFTGPSPNPFSCAVYIELVTGLMISSKPGLSTHFLWTWFVGGHCTLLLFYFSAYTAFAFGLLVALYTMSIWPEMSDRLTSCPPVKTLTLAMGIYLFEMLFSVWTVAYNFVPGGWLTREGTFYLIVFIVLYIGFALLTGAGRNNAKFTSKHMAFRNVDGTGPYAVHADVKILLILLLCTGIGGFVYRGRNMSPPTPSNANPREFSTLIFTAHFMYDNEGRPSFERVAKLLNETDADVITLLESDASRPFLGNNDISMFLSERLHMYQDFGPSTKDHTWGNLLLSKHRIVNSTHHLLPSPNGELAPAISATLNISGTLVDFVTTHMGNDIDDEDRKLQAEYLANITGVSTRPIVFMGYIVSKPDSRDYNRLRYFGKLKDIDSSDNERFCQYIFYNRLKRVGYARISHGELSDTEVQLAKFHIPEKGSLQDNDLVVIDKKKVDPSLHFPARFGNFYNGHYSGIEHRYHMGTPKYFTQQPPSH
ncbi:PGAP2-interacting protein-like isoform X3 [Anneissia japonica]|uniref:PGAP2-interacting protein-like isoform X3 n=1 Tax=Anneissia japonica TaxID=1529436 RepID=UPI001425B81C|nr:PGAP2-interacting protein-like isoform X3 [Anneissia japonica]